MLLSILGGFSIEPLLFFLAGIGLIVLITTYYFSISERQSDRQALMEQYEKVEISLEQDKNSLKDYIQPL
jgi:sensor domain CHASE-containing protein